MTFTSVWPRASRSLLKSLTWPKLRLCGAESSSDHVFRLAGADAPILAATAEKFQETFLNIFGSFFWMKKCNSASKRDEFVIIPAQFPWNREPRSRNGLTGTSDMPKRGWLEQGERRRCSVAPRRASGRQARYSVLRCAGSPPGRAPTHVPAVAVLNHGGTQTGFRGDIVAPKRRGLGHNSVPYRVDVAGRLGRGGGGLRRVQALSDIARSGA